MVVSIYICKHSGFCWGQMFTSWHLMHFRVATVNSINPLHFHVLIYRAVVIKDYAMCDVQSLLLVNNTTVLFKSHPWWRRPLDRRRIHLHQLGLSTVKQLKHLVWLLILCYRRLTSVKISINCRRQIYCVMTALAIVIARFNQLKSRTNLQREAHLHLEIKRSI